MTETVKDGAAATHTRALLEQALKVLTELPVETTVKWKDGIDLDMPTHLGREHEKVIGALRAELAKPAAPPPTWHDAPTPTPATAPSELTGRGAAFYRQLIAAVKRLLSAQDEPERFGCVGPSPSEIAHRNLMQLIQHVCTGIDSPPASATAPTPAWHDVPEVAALKEGRDELLAALHAMLTHLGIDEDEWNKPTFDQARAAIAKAEGMASC